MSRRDTSMTSLFVSALAMTTTLVTAMPSLAQDPRIDAAVAQITPEIIEIRHHLHQHPELSNREFETARLVAEYLGKLGFDRVDTGIAHTGVVGVA